MIINVDFDGVLVPNHIEHSLIEMVSIYDYTIEDKTSNLWDWYDKVVHSTLLPLNIPLLKWLSELREDGHIIRLWTNRNYTNKKPTLDNLGEWVGIFDKATFYSGYKIDEQVEGIVIDNNPKYLSCGSQGGLLVKY